MFDGQPRSANAVAVEDTSLMTIKTDAFRDLMKKNIELSVKVQQRIIEMMCERLRFTDNLLNEGVMWGFKMSV
jgi:CRP-like cAMP-binding protein